MMIKNYMYLTIITKKQMSTIHSIPTIGFRTEDVDVVFNHDHICQEDLKS